MMAARYTLSKSERLKREKEIEALFQNGKALSVFPIRLIWLLVPRKDAPMALQAGFSAAKRRFKRATDRNRIKRLLREQWRINRHTLEEAIPDDQRLLVFLIFTGSELPDTSIVAECMCKAISKLKSQLHNSRHA